MKTSLVFVALVSAVFCRCQQKPDFYQQRRLYHNEKNLSIILEGSQRITHQIINTILKMLLEEIVGYDVVISNTHNSINATEILNRISGCGHNQPCDIQTVGKASIPETMVNLEVWMAAGFNEAPWIHTKQVIDSGPLGPFSRLGWFMSSHIVMDFWQNGTIIDHWRALQRPEIAETFHWMDKLKSMNICQEAKCQDEVFHGSECMKEGVKCATLFASYTDLSKEIVKEQVVKLNLLVEIIWMEEKIYSFVKEQIKNKEPVLLFTWHPGALLTSSKFTRMKLPMCQTPSWSHNCDFDVHQLNKLVWYKIKTNAPKAYHIISKMSFSQENYTSLLNAYNRSSIRSSLSDVACDWIKDHRRVWKEWIPMDLTNKTKVYLGGLFPMSKGLWTEPGLVEGGRLAIDRVNMDPTVLPDYTLELMVSDSQCIADEAMKAFIKYITENTTTTPLAGILGPGCSDAAEPIAALSKHFNMVQVSYGAEAASLSSRDKYPYFFRTIPPINQHRFLYGKLFQEMGWEHVGALAEGGQEFPEYHLQLQSYLKKLGISMIVKRQIVHNIGSIDVSQIFAELRSRRVRIIIADFYDSAARAVMCEAYRQKMTAHEGYVWFLPAWFPVDWFDVDYYNGIPNYLEPLQQENVPCTKKQMEHAIEGHFILSKSFYESDSTKVAGNLTVGEYNEQYEDRVGAAYKDDTRYASFVYDAVWVFAYGLHKLFQRKPGAIDTLHEKSTTLKFMEALNETSFQGVSGFIKFNGSDRMGNVTLLQYFKNGTRTIGHYIPNEKDEEKRLQLNKLKIQWLTDDRRQPNDGHSNHSMYCSVESFRVFLGVTSCEMAIIVANVMGFLGFIIITIFSLILIKCRYDAKVRAMKDRPLLTPDYSHCLALDDWEVPRENVVLNRKLGEGAFGTVYGGEAIIENNTWVAVAVKTLKVGALVEQKLDFFSEAEMMKRFKHPNIVELLAVTTRGEPMYAIMEYLLHGDLKTYLLSRRNLADQETREAEDVSPRMLTQMGLDIANGLNYLHESKYVHRDVACRNCLVHANKTVKISDFGMTRHTFESDYYRFTRKGMLPVRWMSPESLVDGIFTSKSDVWSFGVLMYEIVTFGSFPYQGYSNNQVLEYIKQGKRLSLPDKCSDELKTFIYNCMAFSSPARLDMKSIVEHFKENPEFLQPCLDAPMTSVVMEDTNSLEMALPSTQNSITHSTPVSFLHRRSATSQEKLSPLRKTSNSQGFKFTPLRSTRSFLSTAEKKFRRNSVGTPQALYREGMSSPCGSPLLRSNSVHRHMTHIPFLACSERGEKDNSDYFSNASEDNAKEMCQTITSV